MPPVRQASRSRRYGIEEPTWLDAAGRRQAGAWLSERIDASGLSKRKVLAKIEYEGGTNRLNAYLEGERLPTPEMLSNLCNTVGAPYLEGVAQYGYYREIVRIIDDLVWLGGCWLAEDDARGTTGITNNREWTRLRSVEQLGVLLFGDRPVSDVRNQAWFTSRYHVACWIEPEQDVSREIYTMIAQEGGVTVADLKQPPERVEIVREPERRVYVVLPKPIALAILLVTLLFPRRGDVFKEGARDYALRLWAVSSALVGEAEKKRYKAKRIGRPKNLTQHLQGVLDTLDDNRLPFNDRRVIASEYAIAWADSICNCYTHIARLAAFCNWGEAGSSMNNQTAFGIMPQLRLAELPALEGFAYTPEAMSAE
ncbi:MAG: hypothetical protein M1314_03790 [Firmicutes bacterium]|nr:hypothetical protein [Bacillota bacterium]